MKLMINMAFNKNKKLSEIGKKGAIIRWNKEQNKSKNHLKKISKSNKYVVLKARLLGFLAGDGNIDIRYEKNVKKKKHHDISFYPDHNSMIGPYIEAFTYLYLKKPTIRKKKNYYSVRISSKTACLDLIKTADFGIYKWRVPYHFLDTKESRIEWLKAFFDCEASVSKDQIQVQSVNEQGLIQVKNLLNKLGIECSIHEYKRKNKNWNTNYILCIKKTEMRIKFLNIIGFNHLIKQQKLKNQLQAKVA